MSNNATVKMPAISTRIPKDIGDFENYLKDIGTVENMSIKTWEKIPGCIQIMYQNRIIGAFYLSSKGQYRILTRSTYFKGVPSNGKIIKNGLDMYVSKCDNFAAGAAFIRNATRQFVDKANGKAITLYEADDFTNSATEDKPKATVAKKSAPAKKKQTKRLPIREIKHEEKKPEVTPA